MVFREVFRNVLPIDNFEKSALYLFAWKDAQYTLRLDAKRKHILVDTQKFKVPESEDAFLPLPSVTNVKAKLDVAQPKSKT